MSSTDHLSELESLRSQVADLAHSLAERDQSMQDLREQSQLLRTIIEGTTSETGDEFFASLVTHLTSTLHVQYAVIGEVLEGRLKKIRTLAVSAGGTLADNFEYELAHTPCATALIQTFACFDRHVQATFPQFRRLADLGAESYCGVPIRTKNGAVIGLLVVMDTKPLENSDYLQSLLGVFAPRVAVEIERRRVEQERAQALADLHNVMETVPDSMFTLDRQGNMVRWNRRVEEVTGYSPEELLNKPALAFVPPEEQTRTAAAIQRAFTEGYAELEGHLLTKEHRLIPYHWTGALLKNPHGEPIGITGIGRDVSDKKRTEEELQSQRHHLLEAQAIAHLGSWGWDIDTGEVQWSDELFRIFGHEPESIYVTYDTFLAALLPDDHDRVLAAINDALLGKRPYDIEYRIVRPNGEVQSIHARGNVHRDATGHPLSMAGTVLDITERKGIEDALRASEERWHLAVRGSNEGIWDWNIQTGEVFFSVRWKAMRGYEESELANSISEWQSRIHPVDLERVLQRIDQYLAKQRPEYCEEYRVERKDGSYMWVLDRGMAIWADDGTPLRMAGSESDITERKQAESALAQSERQLRTVLDALPVGVWFTDRAGKPLLANPAAKQIWSNLKQIGMQIPNNQSSWWETIGPVDEPHRRALSQALTSGIPSLGETFDLECLDGTKKTIRNSTVPIRDEAGNILGAIVLNEDITTLRQAQESLRLTQFSVDHAVEGFFWVGPDARILHVNDAACRMLEYTREELTTMTLHDIDPNFPREVWNPHWEELKEKGSLTLELKHWSRTGRVLDTEVTVNYLQYEGKEYNCAIMRDIGERKRAEEALRKSEERYRALYDDTPIMYFTLATDGTVLSVNRFGAEQLGYRVEELVGHSVLGLFHDQDKETFAAGLSECLATPETTKHWEFRKVRKDGSMIWVRGMARVAQSSTEETVVLVTSEDITERRANEQLLASEKRILEMIATDVPLQEVLTLICQVFEGLSSGARCSILLLDRDGLHLRHGAAPSFPEAYVHAIDGLAIGPTVGSCGTAAFMRRQVIVLDIACDPLWADFRDLALRHGFRACWSAPIIASNDTVLGTFAVYYGEPKPPTDTELRLIERATQIARVAIERKRAEAALRLTQFAVDRGGDMAFWIDPSARVLYVNDAACQRLGYSRDELCLMTIPDVDPDYQMSIWLQHWNDLREQKRLRFETRHRTKLGEIYPVEIVANYVAFEGQENNFAFCRDITDRKRAEEVLQQRERDLRAALDERERISQDLHDGILQSLFAVGLTLETSKSMMSPTVRKKSGAPLDQAIDQLNLVMHEVRNFIAGLGSDLLRGQDLPAALKQMLASLTENQPTRVRLAVEDRAAKAVSAEQSLHLIRVIQEAVSNCIRHGRAQEARVSLKMLKQGVRLSIRDNGRGFNPDAAKGIGHGLSNMAARAKKIGGRFTVLSKVKEGTSIVLDLPKEAAEVRS